MMPLRYFVVFLVLATLLGCSTPTATQPEKTPITPVSKGPTLYTAKGCFTSMLNLAQRWSPDAMPFHMESEVNADATGQEGRATVWHAFFASRSRGTMKTVSCSGSRLPTSPALGFSDTPEMPYAANVPAAIFDPMSFQTDSDKAFAVTLEHGGAPLIKKDPQQPIIYLLDWDARKKQLVWWVVYGKSETDRQGLCAIDAKTGAFMSAGK
jgi:hypothetical protein